MSTCSRTGCTKELRSNNKTGVCGSGCLSPEAPPAKRAAGVSGASSPKPKAAPKPRPSPPSPASDDVMTRFHTVTAALDMDGHAILREAAQAWLDQVRAVVQAAGEEE